jgi:Cu/Ag efflux protein CusF
MARSLACAALFALFTLPVAAQDAIQRGKIKKVDTANSTITITTDGKDQEFVVGEKTRIVGSGNRESTTGIRDEELKEGTRVMFKAVQKGGKHVLVGLLLGAGTDQPKGPGRDIRRGKIKKLDLDRKVLTLTIDGKDREFRLTESTQVLSAQGKEFKERFKGIKEGIDVFFKVARRDGKDVLVGLLPVGARPSGGRPGGLPPPRVDTSKFKPLTELGSECVNESRLHRHTEGIHQAAAARKGS